jgi:anion-transporting  ArsA/GET3 family ATPase
MFYQFYLDEIDRRFKSHLKVRVPQLPSDVHGVETLEHLAAMLTHEKALS